MSRAILLGRVFCVVLLSGAFLAQAAADPPDILRNFRLIPSHSTLEQTGGFAGIHLDYTLFGKFGLVTGYDYGVDPSAHVPTIVPHAEFFDVRVAALLNSPVADAAPIPLSRFVDVEALHGTFRLGEPDHLIFKGFDQQDQPFELLAVQRGRLLHLLGANHPQCCDLFNYKIDALAHIAPYADFNFDGAVDTADYTTWRRHFGMPYDATLENGDADGDGDVDGDDYLAWQQQFGASVDLSELAADSLADFNLTTTAVPEPTSLALVVSLVVLSAIHWPRRSRG